ncbi:hypothetical protein H6231_001899 [Enterococcus hirae]|nr:hypothetical protein [Enterococcus hirae]
MRQMKRYRIVEHSAIEFEEYHEGKEKKRREKAPIPLKSIYTQIKRVTGASGKTIARRRAPDLPLRWLLPTNTK